MLGGDSIKSIQILSRLIKIGYKMEIRDLFQYPTVAELAPLLKKAVITIDQSLVTGIIPLTPIQVEFFQKFSAYAHHFNMSVMIVSAAGFEIDITRQVFSHLCEHHDVLRSTFHRDEAGEIIQTIHGLDYPQHLEVIDLRGQENAGYLLTAGANRIQSSLDLENGPLMKLGLFRLDDGDRLLIAVHHLVMDGVSWRILFEDIEFLYRYFRSGKLAGELKLPARTHSFKHWAERLDQYAQDEKFLKEKKYWAQMENIANIPRIERDFPDGENTFRDSNSHAFRLSVADTENLLTRVNDAFGTEINDVLLTALELGMLEHYRHERLLVALEGHGREEILENVNISRTVGWFTSKYPVLLDFTHYSQDKSAEGLARQIKEVKETLRRIPNKGIGYGILKYLTRSALKEDIRFLINPQVSFNYLGQFDTDVEGRSFEMAKESAGSNVGPGAPNEFDWLINGYIAQKQLTMILSFSKNQYRDETVTGFLNLFKEKLLSLIEFCMNRQKKEITPSDLTYSELSIDTIESIDALFSK